MQAINWAILTMHHLSSTAAVDFSSDADVESALAALDRHTKHHPEPQVPTLDPCDESDSGAAVDVVNNVVQTTLHCLRIRRQLLLERGATASTQQDEPATDPETSISPDLEEEAMEVESAEWLPFPTKRPSPMSLENWILDLKSSSHVAGQFKRQRIASPLEEVTPEAAELGVDDETDTAPDKGAYLAMMRKRQYVMNVYSCVTGCMHVSCCLNSHDHVSQNLILICKHQFLQ